MAEIFLKAQVREKTGKEVARKLRQQGLIPAILYGPSTSPTPLSISSSLVLKALRVEKMGSSFFDLEIEGEPPKKVKVLIKDVDVHPVTDEVMHVDFYEIAMDKEVSMEVPIVLTGKPKGVEKGGILEQNLRELTISCLPHLVPNYIEIDISHLDVGDSLHVADISVPEGVKIEDDPQVPVVTIVAAEEEVSEEETEEEEE
ncbi:MAG: 50S ribosomal protein L25/general stress protein Ctc [Candidatus Desulfofervidaceae bacterium]|nr:50S ribosomal protein L25/general stress protein Ctc [Candidatus Desulfofervidaceae bacterium]